MSHFIIRHSDSMRLVYTTTFATREDAEMAGKMILKDDYFIIETLDTYGAAAQHHFQQEQRKSADASRYYEAIREFLEDQAEQGYEEGDSFHVDQLAEAIGFSFVTETTFEITLEVVVKHRAGATNIDEAIDVQVKALYGHSDDIDGIDVTNITIEEQ